MKTLLVTGGCGFIGSNFIKGFLQSHPDWEIVNLDKLTYCGNRENTKALEGNGRYEFVHGDICDKDLVREAMEGTDAVVHFAAETHVDRSIDSANDFLMTNVMGTRALLEAARKRGVGRFIHVSTDEVYGSIADGQADEDSSLKPNSPYSAAKAASDLLVRSYWKTYKFPAIIVRSSNNYGPFQFPEKVIPLFVTNLIQGRKVPLYGDGKNRRQWIYVEDNCKAIELVFDRGAENTIYNIGAGNEMSNAELTHAILAAMQSGSEMIQPVSDRPGHDFRYSISTEKIRNLGFKPQWSFERGLKNTIEWYRKHKEWWEPLKQDKYTVK